MKNKQQQHKSHSIKIVRKRVEPNNIGYACEKLGVAVWKLATGVGEIKERLADAFIEIAILQETDFPQELREKIEAENKIIAGEMEAFALFANAKALNKEAACLLTVSDSNYHKEKNLSAEDRQNAFDEMMLLSLNTAAAVIDGVDS